MEANNVKRLIDLLDAGVRPVIRVIGGGLIEYCDADANQLFRVISYSQTCDKDVHCLVLDFSEFEDHNKALARPDYWDKDGNPTLKWHETAAYPANKRTKYYASFEDAGDFEFVSDVVLEMFEQSGCVDYVGFLERKVLHYKLVFDEMFGDS